MDRASRVGLVLVALGLYLTLRGYHSRDGDQAYRLPLLLHRQDPSLYADDPFVRALDAFNPHRGYLALLDVASRPLGLSVALASLFAATFALTCLAIDRLARSTWPEGRPGVGIAAVGMLLTAKAGNIGTNHLFEAMLLDRLIALALGWWAISAVVADPRSGRWAATICLGIAAVIHPSLGLQLALLLSASMVIWAFQGRCPGRTAAMTLGMFGLAIIPGLALVAGTASALMEGMPAEEFFTLSALVQSPQHMIPHLWRTPQWLAWACYPVLAMMAVVGSEEPESGPRSRLIELLLVNLAALMVGWIAIEVVGSVRVTVFQPFRLATVARGVCLVLAADRVRALWRRGDGVGMARVALLIAGLTGDWALVVATAVEVACSLAKRFGCRAEVIAGLIVLMLGLVFLAQHDTEMGHVRLALALAAAAAARIVRRAAPGLTWNRRRAFALGAVAWAIPMAAAIVPDVSQGRIADALAAHCRFGEWAGDDMERLAAWCRENTPRDSRFAGPPGPKTFRLWSRRELAFNRSASPYHARGLADWTARFRDHVGFRGDLRAFAAAYLRDHQALERRYQEQSDAERADLARRQGADYVIAAAPSGPQKAATGLELVHVEGRYAVYRLTPDRVVLDCP